VRPVGMRGSLELRSHPGRAWRRCAEQAVKTRSARSTRRLFRASPFLKRLQAGLLSARHRFEAAAPGQTNSGVSRLSRRSPRCKQGDAGAGAWAGLGSFTGPIASPPAPGSAGRGQLPHWRSSARRVSAGEPPPTASMRKSRAKIGRAAGGQITIRAGCSAAASLAVRAAVNRHGPGNGSQGAGGGMGR